MLKDETGDAEQRSLNAAFTLPEVIIAAVLLLLSLGLVLSAVVSSKRSANLAQTYLTALQIACNETERLKTNSYAGIGSTNATLNNTLIECQMSRSVTTNTLDTYKDITIAIEWTPPASSRRQVLTNYMTICNTN